MHAFGFAHYPLLFAIVVFAAGVKEAMLHNEKSAILLAGGVALFLLSDVWFRRVLRIGTLRWRLLGAVAALLTVPIGLKFTLTQMLALAAVLEQLGVRPLPASLGPRPNVNTRGETVGELRVNGELEK